MRIGVRTTKVRPKQEIRASENSLENHWKNRSFTSSQTRQIESSLESHNLAYREHQQEVIILLWIAKVCLGQTQKQEDSFLSKWKFKYRAKQHFVRAGHHHVIQEASFWPEQVTRTPTEGDERTAAWFLTKKHKSRFACNLNLQEKNTGPYKQCKASSKFCPPWILLQPRWYKLMIQ